MTVDGPAVDIAADADVAEGAMVVVEVTGREILLVRALGQVHAVDVLCTHADAFLDQGTLDGCLIECPLHGARFDVRDGRPVRGPARRSLRTYPVEVVDGRILVGIDVGVGD